MNGGRMWICIICHQATSERELCGPACASAAEDEIRGNVSRMRGLHRATSRRSPPGQRLERNAPQLADQERYALAYRNGLLTSALMRYRGEGAGLAEPPATAGKPSATPAHEPPTAAAPGPAPA